MIDNAPFREGPLKSEESQQQSMVMTKWRFTASWMQWLQKVGLYSGSLGDSGTTANRPTSNLWVGRPYFDTTLGYPIWVKTVSPVVWVNGAGTSV